jgi:ABC-2 type transport system ATP-binding protein
MNALSAKEETKTQSSKIVTIEGLQKTYKGGTKALQGLDLTINKGDLFGIVGPDGAGKTTALNILCGVMEASSGKILVNGQKPNTVRGQIGYVPQNGALYPELTVDESLRYEAGLHNVSHADYQKRRDLYLNKMGLQDFGDRLTSKLSGGMKQKLALCCALISQPNLLVLDEPTNGLDPVSRRELWQSLAELTQSGLTAVVATPFLDEAERCTCVALLYEGKVHLSGPPKELKVALNLHRIDFALQPDGQSNTQDAIRLVDLSNELAGLGSDKLDDVFVYGDRVEILTKDDAAAQAEVSKIVQKHNFKIVGTRESEPSMENVFIMRLRELGVNESMPREFPSTLKPSSHSGAAISAKGLSKTFEKFQAVKKVDLELQYGEIYGLLGANGAGKTTTIKMLCGLLAPTSGQMTLAGESSNLRSREVRRKIGYMSQKFTLYDALTVRENLDFYAAIYEIPSAERKQKVDWAIEACNLGDMTKSVVGRLPRGWKQRIAFGAAVMHEPEILFLDEPTAGVDPIARRQIWSLVRQMAKRGTAILVTTHYLDEAEYCTRMSLMSKSIVVAEGSPAEIKSQSEGVLYELRSDNTQASFLALTEAVESWRVAIFGDSVHILLHDNNEESSIKEILTRANQNIISLHAVPFSLEDAFIAIVQKFQSQGSAK